MNNYERILTSSIDKLAKILTELMCAECGYTDDWKTCEQIGCWCHKSNGYETYKKWLESEVM